tara:strand:+ start:255 stop:1085 length:831 start_codon:yes stop_codon:yes gene_type:complete
MFKLKINNNDKEVGVIYSSDDYDKFSFKNSNRDIIPNKIKKLKVSIEKAGQIMPIRVNGSFVIQEGQHRFLVCKELGLPVQYFIKDEHIEDDTIIIEANVNSNNWKNPDYSKHWKSKEKESHPDLVKSFVVNSWEQRLPYHVYDMCIQFKIHHRVVLYLNGDMSFNDNDDFRIGNFEIKNIKNFKDKVLYLKGLNEFKDRRLRQIFVNRFFQLAMARLMINEIFDKDRFMLKINSHPHVLTKQGDAEGYVDAILHVYNYASKKKNVLKLRDLNFKE